MKKHNKRVNEMFGSEYETPDYEGVVCGSPRRRIQVDKIFKDVEEIFDASKIGKSPEQTKEAVNHPSHYNAGSIEVIDAIEDWDLGFHEGNVVKYVARAKHKGKELEDLKKAKWYLDRIIQRLENG